MKAEHRNNQGTICTLALLISAMALSFQSFAATHYVSQTSPSPTPPYSTTETAAHDIQDAVDVANDGDIVLVEPGNYGATNPITVTRAIVLQSTMGAGQTFLNNTNDTCLSISNSLAVADGFTVQGPGAAYPIGASLVGGTIQNCNFSNFVIFGSGGSAVAMNGGILSNSVVVYRRGQSDGSAVSCTNGGLVTDCRILGAAPAMGGGGNGVYLADAKMQNSVISGTSGGPLHYGSGCQAVHALSSTIVGCTISNSFNNGGRGGGAYLENSTMDRCTVMRNTVEVGGPGNGGGGIFETNSIIRNSLIVSNISRDPGYGYGGFGGGVYMQGGMLVNCTVSKNYAKNDPGSPGAGGGIYLEGNGAVTNSILYFNTLSTASSSSNWFNAGPGIFDHCCTTPVPGGAGNITQNLQFADISNGNYHLASTSPCIDAGVVQPWMTGAQDLDGNPRVRGASVDMGAYESAPPPILSIMRSGANILLRWPSAGTASLLLQQSADLSSPGSWTPSGATITDDGTHKSATIPATNSVQFFRLR